MDVLQTDGRLTGNQTAYSLEVDGVPFDRASITAETIEGLLVGPGPSGTPPISGAYGNYTFEHGTAAEVLGEFGSDLDEAGQ